jgi:hypothetical protein
VRASGRAIALYAIGGIRRAEEDGISVVLDQWQGNRMNAIVVSSLK